MPRATLARQRAAFLRDGPPSLAERRRDLAKLKDAILARQEAFVAALNADFGHRAWQETVLLDLGSTVDTINYLQRNLRRWMRAERRSVAMVFLPGSNRVVYQPLLNAGYNASATGTDFSELGTSVGTAGTARFVYSEATASTAPDLGVEQQLPEAWPSGA